MINKNQVTLKLLKIKDYTSRYLAWMNNKKITLFTEQRHIKHTKKKLKILVGNGSI
jgi:hypothetical protein